MKKFATNDMGDYYRMREIMFRGGCKVRFLLIGILLFLYFPLSIYAATSLNDYPQIKNHWDDGELTLAIDEMEEIRKNNSVNNEIAELLKKMTFQKKKLDQWIEKATLLEEEKKFKEAKEILDFAKAINHNYSPYRKLVDKIKTTEDELNYPSTVIFDGKSLGMDWKPYDRNGKLSNYGKFENSTLLVDVPEKHKWGQVGIESNKKIINFKETNQSLKYKLSFNFDSDKTTGYAIAIGDIFRLAYKQRGDNKTSFIELQHAGAYSGPRVSYGKLELGTKAPEFLEISMSADNVIQIKLNDGRSIQTVYKKYMSERNHAVKVYSQGEKKDLSVKMALKSIKLQQIPFQSGNLSNLGNSEKSIVLFDGNLNEFWIPFNEQHKNHFRDYVLFNDKDFIVNVPKNNKWGEVGICSPEPLVWLDSLGKDGEMKTTFSFDPLETTGFSIASGGYNHTWKTPWGNYIILSWVKVTNKDTAKLRFKIGNKLLLDEEITGETPSTVTLSFKHGEIGIEGDTFNKKTFEWPHLVENRALHIWAFSRAYKKNLPVKMALKKIVLDRKFGTLLAVPKPAEGVETLPEKEIYGQATIDKWECYQTKAKRKEGNCTLDAPPLHLSLKKGEKSTFGMKSKEKIVHLDRRKIGHTPLKITLHFNPKKTDQFYINFGYHHFSLEKKDQNTYTFKWGKHWSRNVDAKWLKDEWNGKVNVTMGKKWTEIELDGNVAINRPDKVGDKRHLTLSVAPLNTKMKNDASLELQKITKQWLVPDGMTAVERWNFMDDEDFDPEEFLKEIMEEL